ncbi:protein translocase subunit secY/sec61 alpha [Keratinibaculum paraultunense]|uniref:Protein translocase subunit SecY n=1 Tax=Keratinibaculum paraultunense TaxID=1278232 RepID=A0A4R3KPV9_9FIRM|nr:preprotein translocase subunit SecY [Keratinibaculum paraultunense]QQY79395.1 preprotein translocase subunit SecY [Keratinibaculum paraultunense]TCS86142.1 protein translocase subunit secY/sec61 alpha [Keratinibaculum paraultunense]
MLSTLKNAWKIPEIRKRIIFTILMLLVIRLGSAVPVPYMDKNVIKEIFEMGQVGVLEFLDLMAGGTFSNFSIFALNIYPYITASIIIQLLTIAIPKLEEIAKEGEEGRKKIAQWTKYGAIILALIQAIAMTRGFFYQALQAKGFLQNSIVIISLIAGTSFLIWIGDLITDKGIGNGISLIIFVGIISRIPLEIVKFVELVSVGALSPIKLILFLVVALVIIAIVVALQEGERRIPVQYAKRVVGRKMYGGQSTHIPLKVSMSGVIPVIFSTSLLAFPQTIALFFKGEPSEWITKYLTVQGTVGIWVYSILNVLLIIFFTYFYTAIQFNTVEYAKNLQQYGGFIPGIRPGRPTAEYLDKVISRITFVGAISLALIASLPIILSHIFKLNINFGGTAIIIVVGVVLETVKQIESQMMMRHYKGFLK